MVHFEGRAGLDLIDDQAQSDQPTPRMYAWARNSAAYRLARQMLTEKQLFDAISRKAREKFEDISVNQVELLAAVAVTFAYDNGALNDKAYAEIKTRSAMRGGKSKRAIAQKLSEKGVARDAVAAAVAEADDLYAAVVLARKRAFGPFRKAALDEKRTAKELSAFARGGFSFELGKRVFAMSVDEAEDILFAGRSL
ncbi:MULTISPECIES: recombination regulator RecX [Ensifer]|uniref:recombination regulator RecX n=1 Tax=Ensifer TaxID=106591 RepID=UPI000DE0EED5|nr:MULTISPECIES: recombination regulator RecX [Ensifer]MBD9494592.1 recombination regulator RecX [Ensifer sp. ENS01]MBD9518623.1 recombination regulator RecX [Ensifer sp. ENS02]MBW0366832.1 recombination regulator RecX [Ensifer adhaerens]MCY1743943.1 recombination regulator RecX [Ensifer sp. SL37]UCM21930.1 recombination regulator RecX [Ensifer adhaerens]